MSPPSDPRFLHDRYLIRMKVFKMFGEAFHVYGPDQELVFYSELKAFKLKEQIHLYADVKKQEELLTIKARSILDYGATYDVYDTRAGCLVGSLRRKALKSVLRDEWRILDAEGGDLGIIREDHMLAALVRRLVHSLMPQSFDVLLGGDLVTTYRQAFNPFVLKLHADFGHDPEHRYDRRLGLAAGILLCAIEGRQD